MNDITAAGIGYQEFKRQLDGELSKSVESFVRIGYLLRLARDTDILAGSGYENVNEFAEAEYRLEKSAVSRFIAINERFTLPEDHTTLREQYRGVGHAKLALMLTLPDELNEELPAGLSKQEIREVKQEYDEEQKISDVEVWLEGQEPAHAALESDLEKAVYELGRDEKLFRACYELLRETRAYWEGELRDILAPDGEAIHSLRVRGVGGLMLFVKDTDTPVTLLHVRSNERKRYSWEELRGAFRKAFKMHTGASWKSAYWMTYGEKPGKKEEIAPAQPEEKVQKKSKVIRHKEAKNVGKGDRGTESSGEGGTEAPEEDAEGTARGAAQYSEGSGGSAVEVLPETAERWENIEKNFRDIMEDMELPRADRHPGWISGLLGLIQLDLDEIRKAEE